MLSALAFGLFSCSEEDRLLGDQLTGDKIVGFQQAVTNVTYFEDIGPVTIEVPVTLVGLGNGQLSSSDIVVNYSVDMTQSTAVEGQEFTFANNSGSVTIPAGSDFAMIPVVVNTGSLNPTEATKLVLQLSSSDEGVVVGHQYQQATVNFVGCVSQIQTGSYTVTRGPGSTLGAGTTYQDVITMVGTNTFSTAHTPPYLGVNESPAGLPSYGFIFEDVCGEITMAPQNLFNYYSNSVNGSGQVIDSDASTFEIDLVVGGGTTYFTYLTFTKN